jgi:GNAT superfamily N-acetyltransferase
LEFRAVDRDNWADLERLFAARGGPKSCWCMVWRATPAEARQPDGRSRKKALCSRIAEGIPVGILGYLASDPVAWCSIAPRRTHRRLGGPDDFQDDPDAVWSLVCFFVKRQWRGRGATEQLLAAAIDEARRHRAKIVEAYPVDRHSPSYRFMGFIETFREAGFREVGHAGLRRRVFRLALR